MEQKLNSDQHENESHVIVDDILPEIKVAQCNVEVQMVFLRKVFGILSLQLTFTNLITVCMVITLKEKYSPMLVLATLTFVISLVAMQHSLKHKTPKRYIVLTAITACKAFLAGAIVNGLSSFNRSGAVIFLVLTFVVTMLLTVYTLQTKLKYTTSNARNAVVLVLFSFPCFLMLLGGMPDISLVFIIGGVIVVALFIIYDTDLIMNHLSPDEYILAIIILYLHPFQLISRFLEYLKSHIISMNWDVKIAKTSELSKVEKI